MICNYKDFVKTLLAAGFSMLYGNTDNMYAVVPWGWNDTPPYDTPVRWHTGDPDTDPWEWRIRVLDERDDIAYAKLFFKKGGYLTKDWYPYFLAARRAGKTFEDAYADGELSHFAKRIYDVLAAHDRLPVHLIKAQGGFSREDKPSFDKALVELQMKMYLTTCGTQAKLSQMGLEHGWASTVFCTTESFFGREVFEQADAIRADEAYRAIRGQMLRLNPLAEEKNLSKFIFGTR